MANPEHAQWDDEQRGYHIGTATGRPYYFESPRLEDIQIIDVAVQLSRICRFGGALKPEIPGIYSVAQHLVHCHDVAPPEFQLEALVHDAHEAYVHDISAPIKWTIADYRGLETDNELCMREFFELPLKTSAEVKKIDKRMFATECRDLCAKPQDGLIWGPDTKPYQQTIKAWTPLRARKAWLDRLHRHWSAA